MLEALAEHILSYAEGTPRSDARRRPGEPARGEPAVISSDAAETVSSASPTSDATLLAGCSVVDFCNAPGSEGTRCRQQGCGVHSAVNECKSEVPGVCGSPVSPWIFVTLDGVHHSSRDAIAPARSARPASATSRSATCSV